MSADPLPVSSSSLGARPLTRDVILADGSTLRLRAPGPEDYDDVKAFYDRLSTESRYMRFHGEARTDMPSRSVVEAAIVAMAGRRGADDRSRGHRTGKLRVAHGMGCRAR